MQKQSKNWPGVQYPLKELAMNQYQLSITAAVVLDYNTTPTFLEKCLETFKRL